MAGKGWQSLERQVAKDFGGKRHVRVSYSESNEDIDGVDDFVIECKKHKQVASKMRQDALEQAEHYNNKKYGGKKISIGVIQQTNKQIRTVVLRVSSLRRLCKEMNFPKDGLVEVSYTDLVNCYQKFRNQGDINE